MGNDATGRVQVRFACAADASLIVHFIRELAAFEKEPPESVRITESDVKRDGFGPSPCFETLIAELDGAPVGFALFFPNYSTWEGRSGLYVEDIFVEEHARRHGVGRQLMAAVARIAEQRGFARIDLAMLDWNPARAFYRSLGFEQMESWQPFRLAGSRVSKLARQSRAVNPRDRKS